MNLSFWITALFWSFILGFWLGLLFPTPRSPKRQTAKSSIDPDLDFYISNKEYSNFLSYDGTTQEKE